MRILIAFCVMILASLTSCAASASTDVAPLPTATVIPTFPSASPSPSATVSPTRAPLATLAPSTRTAATPAPSRSAPPLIGSGGGAGSTVITSANAQNLKLLREFTVRPGMVNLALSPDGRTVAIGHDDGNLSLLRLPTPLTGDVKSPELLSGHQQEVTDLTFSPDGSLLASTSTDADGTTIRDGQTGQTLYRMSAGTSLAFSPDGKQLALGDADGNVTLWSLGQVKATKESTLTLDNHGSLCSVGYAAGGTLLVAGYCDYTLAVWDSASRKLTQMLPNVRKFECATLHCDYLISNKLALSPAGALAASIIPDEKVGIWDASTGSQPRVLAGEGEHLQADSAAFTPDGKLLALARWNTIFVYDVATWKLLTQVSVPRTPDSAMTQLRFSADGKMLVAGSNGKVLVWGIP